MNNIETKIATRYNNSLAIAKRKNITFNVDEETLERLDSVVNFFNEKDGSTTRNAVIEDAVMAYIEAAEDFFEKQNLNEDNKEKSASIIFDTAVFPATNSNFGKVFIGEKKWYYVRIAAYRVEKIKYVALYRGAPISAITHYAEVIDISEPNEDNKRLIKLKDPVAFTEPIELGNIHVNNVRKLFYTCLEKLNNVNTVEELIKHI